MNIVNDYTNKPWSIPLKSKDDGFGKLKVWILAWENEMGEKLGVLHTGHDSKFNSEEHKQWYKSKGIILEVKVP